MGGNKPCPCGSGKKYKLCCLINVEKSKSVIRRNENNVIKRLREVMKKRELKTARRTEKFDKTGHIVTYLLN